MLRIAGELSEHGRTGMLYSHGGGWGDGVAGSRFFVDHGGWGDGGLAGWARDSPSPFMPGI